MTRILWGSLVALCALLASCTNQEEGERCDLANGHDDCEPGLECRSLQAQTGSATGAICCPPREEGASVPACQPGSIQFDEDDDDIVDDSSDDVADDTADAAADDTDAASPEEPPSSDSGAGGRAPTSDAATPALDAAADSGADAG